MKKAILLLSVTILLTVYSTKIQAQFVGTFYISDVVGLPDTVLVDSTYAFGFKVFNAGNTSYSGTIDFDFYVDTFTPGVTHNFGTGQVGNFFPGDSVTIPINYTFSVSNNDFHIGDDVVVVWPRGLVGSTAIDSLVFNVYIAYYNGVEENKKANSDLKVFPNPAKDFLSFTSEKNTIEEVKLYDMTGRLVLQSKSHLKVFTGHLTFGVYIAEARLSNGIITRKKIMAGTVTE